jgi:urate oxidase
VGDGIVLGPNRYGKSSVRVFKVHDDGEVGDLTVHVACEGDFAAVHLHGDNTAVVPTDTMKNTVYALAAREGLGELEAFGLRLGQHFLERNRSLRRVRIDLTQQAWRHIRMGDRDHPHAFMQRGPDVRTAIVQSDREATMVGAGVSDLMILKSSRSAFAGFPRDEYTTLAETQDRLLATSLTGTWRYATERTDFGRCWHAVRQTLLQAFAEHDSQSVQHTLHAMAQGVLDAHSDVTAVRLVMPNKHHLPMDLTPFGLPNRNEIFVPTDEPYGLIEATLVR